MGPDVFWRHKEWDHNDQKMRDSFELRRTISNFIFYVVLLGALIVIAALHEWYLAAFAIFWLLLIGAVFAQQFAEWQARNYIRKRRWKERGWL